MLAASSDSDSDSDEPWPEPDLKQLLSDVAESTDKLIKLLGAIQASSRRGKSAKAQAYEDWDSDYGISRSKEFEVYMGKLLDIRYGGDDRAHLRNRLQTAISRCRRQFAYRRRHQRKLFYGGGAPLDTLEIAGRLKPETSELASEQVLSGVLSGPSISPTALPSRPPMSQTTFSKVHSNFRPLDTKSSITSGSASSRISGNVHNAISPPPQLQPSQRNFQCPYCCILLPRSKSEVRAWR